MKLYQKYKKEIAYLESLSNIEKQKNYMDHEKHPEIYLKRLAFFLRLLGNPQKKIKNYIHIGGTSGKGSVANFIHNILVASGKKSGLFTSPFMTETIEKYKIGNRLISPREFIDVINKIKSSIDKCDLKSPYGIPSYFEICFVIAILYFTSNKCQYFVSEVGCGGEFDATNILKKSKFTIITHIDFDHTEMLGKTLAKIAKTKSKIIKPKSFFFTLEKRPHIRQILKRECQRQKAEYNLVTNKTKKVTHKYSKFHFEYKGELYKIKLWGQHQVENAILAIEMTKKLNIKLKYIRSGLAKTKIPGRFEIVRKRPLIVLDVAHNPDKIKTILDNLGLLNYEKLYLVYASAANKDAQKIAKLVSPFVDRLYLTKYFVTQRKCADPKALQKIWRRNNFNIKINTNLDPWQALDTVLKKSSKKDCIVVAGSFFLVGELRKKWRSSEKILRTRKII